MMELKDRIHVVIPTIPERAHLAGPLFQVMSGYLGESVQLYQDVDRSLVMSHAKGFFMGLASGKKWCGVAEDDIILCDDFWFRLDWVLARAELEGFSVIKLYNNSRLDEVALKAGKSWRWIPGREYSNDQFTIMGRGVVERFQKFFDREDLSTYKRGWSDVLIRKFLVQEGYSVHIALPNLVDHLNEKSTIGYSQSIGGIPRKSRTFNKKLGL